MNAKKEKDSSPFARVVTLLTPEQVARLDQVAERKTMSRSLLIRQACEQLLSQEEERQAA